jgi:hypothetical protein
MRSFVALVTFVTITSFAVACGSGPGAHRPAAPVADAPPPRPEAPIPADPSPNVLRDRRAEPGVRAPAKPLVLGNAKSAKCGKLTKGTEADDTNLLAGRLRVRAPAGWKVPPPLPDGPSPEEEARIVVEGDKLSLAIVARETFQLDPDLYEAEPDSPVKPGTLDVEAPKFLKATFFGGATTTDDRPEVVPVEVGAGPAKLRAYAARPRRPNAPPGQDTALVLALLVAQEDGPLQSVAFYVRGETVRNATGADLVGCMRLAERIASTLEPGPRKLERAAGVRKVADVSTDDVLTVTVPKDWVAIQAGAGVRLVKLRPLSQYAGSISILVGQADEEKEKKALEGADATAAGKLLGRPIEWRGRTTPKGGFLYAAEPIDGDKSKTAEVLIKATRQQKALDEMRQVAETLAVVKRGAR